MLKPILSPQISPFSNPDPQQQEQADSSSQIKTINKGSKMVLHKNKSAITCTRSISDVSKTKTFNKDSQPTTCFYQKRMSQVDFAEHDQDKDTAGFGARGASQRSADRK